MKLFVKILKYVFWIVILLISIIILYKVFAKVILKEQFPKILGYGSATVISGSMKPSINIGDYIVVKEKKEYFEGDIVIYNDEDNTMVTHRIIDKNNQEFITKGDNNNIADKPITKDKIKGKVILVLPVIGSIQMMLLKPISIMIIFILVVVISMIYFRKKGDNSEVSN